jgi:hypothetical protein
MTGAAVPDFLPSRHGFRFANSWPPGPTVAFGRFDPRLVGIGDASAGLCGGMVATVRDLFEAGIAPPLDADPPANGSRRFRAIVRRQVESLDWLRVPLRFYDLQAWRPDPPTRLSAILRRPPPRIVVVRDAWPLIRADIEAGRAPIVGLVRTAGCSPRRLTANHQVLAYAYEEDAGGFRIRIYDPNHPGRDDVELIGRLDELGAVPSDEGAPPPGEHGSPRPGEGVRLGQSTGEPLLGFFRQPYPPPGSLAAWR